MSDADSLLIPNLHAEYRAGRLTPTQLVRRLTQIPDDAPLRNIWIARLDFEHVVPYLRALEGESVDTLPLFHAGPRSPPLRL